MFGHVNHILAFAVQVLQPIGAFCADRQAKNPLSYFVQKKLFLFYFAFL
jgi:hypothetical protein